MIGSLRGSLLWRGPEELLVEVAGVGYRLTVMPTTAVGLGEVGSEVFLHVHHHVREDAQVLYGFGTLEERRCFEALLGAHGVGPALALAILSVHPPAALARVLAEEDLASLCLVPGVGKKTAARLLVELTSRLDLDGVAGDASAGATGVASADTAATAAAGGTARGDVREALVSLGYQTDEVAAALRDLPEVDEPSELLRQALQRLAVA